MTKTQWLLTGITAALGSLTACSGGGEGSVAAPGAGLGAQALGGSSKVVGYFTTWSGDPETVPYNNLTHIIYSFVLPTSEGGLSGISMSGDARLTRLVQKAHANGVKVLIAVGGWMDGNDGPFVTVAGDATKRKTFIGNLSRFVSNYGLDGVDVDWEHPSSAAESQGFSTLMDELGAEMRRQGKLTTAAVISQGAYADFVRSDVFADVDWLNIMAYDEGTPHSTYALAESAVNYWANRGLPASKVLLGVPFYGRIGGTTLTYRDLVAADAQAPYKDFSSNVYYNGLDTIKKKAALAKDRGLGGIMIWELGQDTSGPTSLLGAIAGVLGGTSQPAPQPTPQPTPAPGGVSATFGTSSTWAGGFNGTVTLKNNGTAPINGWTLNFKLSGDARASGAWGAAGNVSTASDGTVTVTPNTWGGATIPAGGSVSIGYGGSGTFSGVTGCTLNGVACAGSAPAPAPQPAPTPAPQPQPSPTPTPSPTPSTGCPAWAESNSTVYRVGDRVSYGGANYTALSQHTPYVGANWNPKDTPTLWKPGGSC